jgi:hypothetical protein
MGGILGGGGGTKAKPASPYAAAQFKPYTYTGTVGNTEGTQVGTDGFNVSSTIQPGLTGIANTSLQGAQPLLDSYLSEAARTVPGFSFNDDTQQREQDIFNQQSALLQPAFQQQNEQLQNTLFGSGRLGLQLAGDSVGAGSGAGFVQPDAFGLGRAQSLTLADLAGKARGVAQQEQAQQFGQGAQGYALNTQAQQQQLANLLGGFQGGLGAFGSVVDLENSLVNQGLNIEQARSVAQSASANAGSSLAQAGTPASSGGGGMFSGLLKSGITAAAGAFGGPLGAAAAGALLSPDDPLKGAAGSYFGSGGYTSPTLVDDFAIPNFN